MRGRVQLLSAEGAPGRICLCRVEDAGQAEVVRVPPDHGPGGTGQRQRYRFCLWARGQADAWPRGRSQL